MTETQVMSKAELINNIKAGWNAFETYLKSLSQEQLSAPADAAGWKVKDHLVHIAVWEGSILALLNGQRQAEYLGVEEEIWKTHDFDKINAIPYQRYQNKSVAEVLAMLRSTHQQVVEKLETLTDDDLKLPYRHYILTSTSETPVAEWIKGNTYEHFQEHTPWIEEIISGK